MTTPRTFRSTILICGCALSPCVAAEPAILSRVRSVYDSAASLQAEFSAEIYWLVREKTDRKTGKIWLARGDKFRVEIDGMVWVSDGATCWQYNPGSRQVTIKPLQDMDVGGLPSHLLRSYLHNRQYRLDREAGGDVFVVSDSGTAAAQPVVLGINRKTALVTTLRFTDVNGNRSTYAFRKTVIGAPVAREKFTFAPPANTDVLDLRR